jgi:hypothetical protein
MTAVITARRLLKFVVPLILVQAKHLKLAEGLQFSRLPVAPTMSRPTSWR